jgi:hypothetical protein
MDCPTRTGEYLTVRELKMLRQAGIETGIYFSLHWDKYEPTPGKFNSDYFLDILDRYQNAGMKVILPLWNTQGSHFPDAWYCKRPDGGTPHRGLDAEYIISPWSAVGQAYSNKILAMVSQAYGSDKVLVIASGMRDGETIMPQEPLYFGGDAIADWQRKHRGTPDRETAEGLAWLKDGYTRMLIDRQKALDTDELWVGWHMRKATMGLCYGVQWANDYMGEYQSISNAPVNINHITYSYFPMDDMPVKIAEFSRTWGTNEWVGAEYCHGLRDGNAIKAHDAGLRGLVLGPCHPYTGCTKIEPWMLAEIEKAVKLWD